MRIGHHDPIPYFPHACRPALKLNDAANVRPAGEHLLNSDSHGPSHSVRLLAIDRFQAQVPTGSDVAGLSVLGAAVAPAEEPDKLQFQIALASAAPLGDPGAQ